MFVLDEDKTVEIKCLYAADHLGLTPEQVLNRKKLHSGKEKKMVSTYAINESHDWYYKGYFI